MAYVSTYLNFNGNTEEAFNFYKGIFGGEFEGGLMRFKDMPAKDQEKLTEDQKNLVMHVSLKILGGHHLMGTDAVESMGFKLIVGTNVYITLAPDTRAEADKLFAALSAGGVVEMPMQDMFWGDYYGSFKDKFGVCWMIACSSKN